VLELVALVKELFEPVVVEVLELVMLVSLEYEDVVLVEGLVDELVDVLELVMLVELVEVD